MTGMGGMQPMTGMGGMQPMTGMGGMQPMIGMGGMQPMTGMASVESQAALYNSAANAQPQQPPACEASNLELIKALTDEVARLRGMLENKLNSEAAGAKY